MKCPYCGHLGDKVVDSRESREGDVIRRRRQCLNEECHRRFTSYERIDEIPYMVVKKDGTRERFERQKLMAGLLKACEKRPVSVAAIEEVADHAMMLLLAAHRRAANILRIEEKRDGHTYDTGYERHLLKAHEEEALAAALEAAAARIELDLSAEDFERAMEAMATLRAPVDAFFDKVIVNDPAPELRRNRLKLLARLRATMDAVADFSKIEA